MGAVCYCDYESPSMYRAARPIARRPHRCHECGSAILVGERYESVVGIYSDGFHRYCTCVDCLLVRDQMDALLDCWCWSHGGLWEDAAGALENTEFKPGVRFGLVRLIAAHRARRRKQSEVAR